MEQEPLLTLITSFHSTKYSRVKPEYIASFEKLEDPETKCALFGSLLKYDNHYEYAWYLVSSKRELVHTFSMWLPCSEHKKIKFPTNILEDNDIVVLWDSDQKLVTETEITDLIAKWNTPIPPIKN